MDLILVGEPKIDCEELFLDKIKEFKVDTIVFTKGFVSNPDLMEKIYKTIKNVFIMKGESNILYCLNDYGWLKIIDKPRRFNIEGYKVVFCPYGTTHTFDEYDVVIGENGVKVEQGMYVYNLKTKKDYGRVTKNFDWKFKDIEHDDNKKYNYYHLNKKIGVNNERKRNPGINTITFYKEIIH